LTAILLFASVRGLRQEDSMKDTEQLAAWLRNIETAVRDSVRPAVFLRRTGLPVPLEHPAGSYFGGLPKLPAHLAWPLLPDGEEGVEDDDGGDDDVDDRADHKPALLFICQIDLAELPASAHHSLPSVGTLYFFFDANNESPDGHEVCVLHYAGSARELPAREPPGSLQACWQSWEWLDEDDPAARIGFKYPLSFVELDSYSDTASIDDLPAAEAQSDYDLETSIMQALREIAAVATPIKNMEFDAKVTGSDAAAVDGPLDASPFAFGVIEHTARAVRHQVRQEFRFTQAAPALVARFAEITARVEQWLQRIAGHAAVDACDEQVKAWFRQEWAWLTAAVESAKSTGISLLDLSGARERAAALTCCLCASTSAATAASIPASIAGWHERRVLWQSQYGNRRERRMVHHQLLGYGTSVQSAPYQHKEDVLLLQISGWGALEWFDHIGCVLQFWIGSEELAQRAFEHTQITLDCS
jgi:hypothetical protein